MARDDPQMKLRLPDELLERIRERAELNGRSINSEIVGALANVFPKSGSAIDILNDICGLFRYHREKFTDSELALFDELHEQLEEEIRRLQKFERI